MMISLLGCEIKNSTPSTSQEFTFSVKAVKSSQVHYFAAESEEDYQLWLQTVYVARLGNDRTKSTDTSEACVLQ